MNPNFAQGNWQNQAPDMPRIIRLFAVGLVCLTMLILLFLPGLAWLSLRASAPLGSGPTLQLSMSGSDVLRILDGTAAQGRWALDAAGELKTKIGIDPLAALDRNTLKTITDVVTALRGLDFIIQPLRALLWLLPLLLIGLAALMGLRFDRLTPPNRLALASILVGGVVAVGFVFSATYLIAQSNIDRLLEQINPAGAVGGLFFKNEMSAVPVLLLSLLGIIAAIALAVQAYGQRMALQGGNASATPGVAVAQPAWQVPPPMSASYPAYAPSAGLPAYPAASAPAQLPQPVGRPLARTAPVPRPATQPAQAWAMPAATKRCHTCQQDIPVTSRFCKNCGSAQ